MYKMYKTFNIAKRDIFHMSMILSRSGALSHQSFKSRIKLDQIMTILGKMYMDCIILALVIRKSLSPLKLHVLARWSTGMEPPVVHFFGKLASANTFSKISGSSILSNCGESRT